MAALTDDAVLAITRQVEAALASGVDLPFGSIRDGHWKEWAFNASAADCPRYLTVLLEQHGVDVNSVGVDGHTLLTNAAKCGSAKCVPVLLSHGANVNKLACQEDLKFSPLYVAAMNGHIAVCRQLLDAGASVDFRGRNEATPLHVAARYGRAGIAALLVQRGADARALDSDLATPIDVACLYHQVLAVKTLLPYAELACDRIGLSVLHTAATCACPAVLEAVLPRFVEAGLIDIPASGVSCPASKVARRSCPPLNARNSPA